MSTTFTRFPFPYAQTQRTNQCVNPSFEVDASGWAPQGTGATLQRRVSGGSPVPGVYCLRLAASTTVGNVFAGQTPALGGFPTQIWSVSAYVRGTPGRNVQMIINNGVTLLTGPISVLTAAWQRISYQVTLPAGTTSMAALVLLAATAVGDYVDIDGVLVEQVPAAVLGSYFDGSTPPVAGSWAVWTGTAGLSTSTLITQAPIVAETSTMAPDTMEWEDTRARRVTEHWLIGVDDPVVTVASRDGRLDYRRGTFQTWHLTETDAQTFAAYIGGNAVMLTDPERLTLPPYVVIREAVAAPWGDERRRWTVRGSWTEVHPAGLQ